MISDALKDAPEWIKLAWKEYNNMGKVDYDAFCKLWAGLK